MRSSFLLLAVCSKSTALAFSSSSTPNNGGRHESQHHRITPKRRTNSIMAVIMIGASSGSSRLGSRSSASSHHMASSPTSQEVDLYDEQGEEIMDIDISMDADIDVTGDGNLEYGVEDNEKKSKKLIECSARISLPFSVDVAFDAFSDLTRQPSWCKYLHSVEYMGLVDDGTNNNNSSEIPLRKSKWTVGVRGLRFSWTANDTLIKRPHRIEWESTSGMKNVGSVQFTPCSSSSSSSTDDDTMTPTTDMTLYFTFVAPRVVASLFRRSNKIRKYTEDVLLMNMLTDFRDVVMDDNS